MELMRRAARTWDQARRPRSGGSKAASASEDGGGTGWSMFEAIRSARMGRVTAVAVFSSSAGGIRLAVTDWYVFWGASEAGVDVDDSSIFR